MIQLLRECHSGSSSQSRHKSFLQPQHRDDLSDSIPWCDQTTVAQVREMCHSTGVNKPVKDTVETERITSEHDQSTNTHTPWQHNFRMWLKGIYIFNKLSHPQIHTSALSICFNIYIYINSLNDKWNVYLDNIFMEGKQSKWQTAIWSYNLNVFE